MATKPKAIILVRRWSIENTTASILGEWAVVAGSTTRRHLASARAYHRQVFRLGDDASEAEARALAEAWIGGCGIPFVGAVEYLPKYGRTPPSAFDVGNEEAD